MNIVILGEISQRKEPSQGGTGLGLVRLANGFTALRHHVSIITSSKERFKLLREEINNEICIYSIGYNTKHIQFFYLLYQLYFLQPCILLARDSRAILLACWCKKIFKNNIYLFCSFHNENNIRVPSSATKLRKKSKRMRLLQKNSDGIICVSPGIREKLLKWISFKPQHIKTIPNPAYLSTNNKDSIPRPLTNAFHIVTVGRIEPEKGHIFLIHALYLLIQRYNIRITLTIIGEGKKFNELKKYVSQLVLDDYVFFLGYISNPIPYLLDADLYICSSWQEAFGYTLVEALSVGLPVVSTDCPYGPRYILDNGRYGTLVPVNDSFSLADAIYKDLHIVHDKQSLKERARYFDKSNVLHQYLDFFNEIHASKNVY